MSLSQEQVVQHKKIKPKKTVVSGKVFPFSFSSPNALYRNRKKETFSVERRIRRMIMIIIRKQKKQTTKGCIVRGGKTLSIAICKMTGKAISIKDK